ncbi:MAG: nicotinate-nucleotide--dimethylbenzimidazole phosphoribosyltransferase [Chloroflexota bacterium]
MKITIPQLNKHAMQQAREQQDMLLKPKGALGQLETLSIQLAGMTGRCDWLPQHRAVLVFAGDHGVMAHNLSSVPQAITAYMVNQFMAGQAAINVLARQANARVTVIDAGVNADLSLTNTESLRFVSGKVAYGTNDFTVGQAISAEKAQKALQLGADVVKAEIQSGLDILVLGEMGIGNTTSASAIIAAITGNSVETVTGRGTGVDNATYQRKIKLITEALELHTPVNVDTLAKIGGYEIGAMAGAMLYAASQRIPIVLDGLICTAAALIANQINPSARDYMLAGHCGAEPGHRIALNYLTLEPILHLNLRLGEGTGAVLALPIIEVAMRTLNEMGTLDVG